MTSLVQPAYALPQQQMPMTQAQPQMAMAQPQMAMAQPQMAMAQPMTAQQQLPYAGAYGMPQYGMPQYGMPMGYGMGVSPYGALPASQGHLAQALGQGHLGAQVVQPEGPSPIKSALKGAAVGAAAGAAFGIIPFLPLGLFSGALVGAGVGAALGLVKGLKAKKQEGEFHTMEQQQAQAAAQAQAQMVASTPPGARSAVAAEAQPKQGVVMGPEMRRKWAAKVRAEKAAVAAKAT